MKFAAHPINWSNDDFRELGENISLETCLEEIKAAGYTGTELGHKFPADPKSLSQTLDRFGLRLASGWHSLYLLTNPQKEEEKRFRSFLDLLYHCNTSVVTVAECSGAVYSDRNADPLNQRRLSASDLNRLVEGLERLADLAAGKGMKLAYHPHVGTLVESEMEIDRVMKSSPSLYLLADTGHLTFAGADALTVMKRYIDRIAHVHLKNVRFDIVTSAKQERLSFEQAVKRGVFTVPGDGGINFEPILQLLLKNAYRGWVTVEAEQDPLKAAPFEYAKKARDYLRNLTEL